jgi:hypothetical protein
MFQLLLIFRNLSKSASFGEHLKFTTKKKANFASKESTFLANTWGQFHQHILAAFFAKTRWDPFLGKWRLANSKLIWQISPYKLGKFHQHRMLVKLNGECFAECCFPAIFRTKVSEIDTFMTWRCQQSYLHIILIMMNCWHDPSGTYSGHILWLLLFPIQSIMFCGFKWFKKSSGI